MTADPVRYLLWATWYAVIAAVASCNLCGCAHVCATGWSVSAGTDRGAWGPGYSAGVELSGGIGGAQCQRGQ